MLSQSVRESVRSFHTVQSDPLKSDHAGRSNILNRTTTRQMFTLGLQLTRTVMMVVMLIVLTCTNPSFGAPVPNNERSPGSSNNNAVNRDVGAMAMQYLQHYGYMDEQTVGKAAALTTNASTARIQESMRESIIKFQEFAQLKPTGVLDEETIEMMKMPRCGVRDLPDGGEGGRKKRYVLQGSKWRVGNLTFRVSKYPTKYFYNQRYMKDRLYVDKEMAKAFKVWSDVTNLNFIPKETGRVHIDIRFVKGDHNDDDPFDGPGGTLAHAFFPQYGGDVHFDDEEKWSMETYEYTNMFQVAAHEFGHSLGLSHSNVRSALMAPFYKGYLSSFKLHHDDIQAIQEIYGKRVKNTKVPDSGNGGGNGGGGDSAAPPDICEDARIDAATRTADGKSYVFKGDYYWQVETRGIANGYPRKISADWGGIPGNLDAALTWRDGKTFFFKGNMYWKYYNKNGYPGYPKRIDVGFEGIPNNIDAAFVWPGNNKTYFFKGDQYWKFESHNDPPVSSMYPQPINKWGGLPNNIDAAFQWEDLKLFFFKGTSYYRFSNRSFSVDVSNPPYPRPTAIYWFDCQTMSEMQPHHSGLADGNEEPIYVGEDTKRHQVSDGHHADMENDLETTVSNEEQQLVSDSKVGSDKAPTPNGNGASPVFRSTTQLIAIILGLGLNRMAVL